MTAVFLAWQDPGRTRAWYPIGRLDADSSKGPFRFCYVRGAERASREAGLRPLVSFPDFGKRYQSNELFPLFRNRILSPDREEFDEYLRTLDINPAQADPLEILAITGGRRQTDTLEVFPRLVVADDGTFCCRFFLHGWRHVSEAARQRIFQLRSGDELRAAIEINNPATGLAVQIQTTDYHMIGWTPRYLVIDIVRLFNRSFQDTEARIVKIIQASPISQLRVLVEMKGFWPEDSEPMSNDDLKEWSS